MKPSPTRPRSLLARLRRNENGGTAVEFALILPALMVVTIGLIDIGRMMWYRTTLEHIAREGTRYAAVRGASNPFPASLNSVITYVQGRTVGISNEDLTINVAWAPNNASGSTVTISVAYDFSFLITGFLPLGPIRLASDSTMVIS